MPLNRSPNVFATSSRTTSLSAVRCSPAPSVSVSPQGLPDSTHRRTSCAEPTKPLWQPNTPAEIASRFSPRTCRSAANCATILNYTFDVVSNPTPFAWSTYPRSTYGPATLSGPRHWSGGSTPPVGCWHRAASSLWPNPSTLQANWIDGCCGGPAMNSPSGSQPVWATTRCCVSTSQLDSW